MSLSSFLCSLFFLCGHSSPGPAIDVAQFLTTEVCVDGSLAVVSGCNAPLPALGATSITTWRYDWAHADQSQVQVTYRLDNQPAWVATFNYPPHGGFVASDGDGGDVYVFDGTRVRISYTQNGDGHGGSAAGWWVGARCKGTGWLSFDKYVNDKAWRSWTARLKGATDPNACPPLDAAFTRAIIARKLPISFILQDAQGNVTNKTVPLDAIVSEHYGGSSISSATSMERQVHVAGVGPSVFWEAWVKNPSGPAPSFQCDGAPNGWSAPPGLGWVLWDRRCRTVIRAAATVMTGDQWGWPPANATQ